MKFRILITLSFFLFVPILLQAQTDKLKALETSVNNAKAKVSLNERKLVIADSLVNVGNQMISESKAETKAIDADSKKLDKDYSVRQKPLVKLAASKDKAEALKSRADLKVIDTQYRADTKAIETRIRDAAKKQSTGSANVARGKTAKKTAQDALKASQALLKTAQAKYDAAAAPPEDNNAKGKGKK